MSSPTTVAALLRSLRYRADAFEEIVQGLRGPLGASRPELQAALEVVEAFPRELRAFAETELQRAADEVTQIAILSALAVHVTNVLDLIEGHFAHGTRRELTETLTDEVKQELDSLGLSAYKAVLAHGEAHNYTTRQGDVERMVFGPIRAGGVSPSSDRFALFRVPRLEGAGVQWRPLLLGHEVAHVAVVEHGGLASFDLISKFDVKAAGGVPNPAASASTDPTEISRGLFAIAESWAAELICDAYAVRRFGPSAVMAFADYFTAIGAMGLSATTHPPGALRVELLATHLGTVPDPRLQASLQPWRDEFQNPTTFPEPWMNHLGDLFRRAATDIHRVAQSFPGHSYDVGSRAEWVHRIADAICEGRPGRESLSTAAGTEMALNADVVNAVWLARSEGAETPYDSLGLKTIENLAFVRRWTEAGGTVPSAALVADPGDEDSADAVPMSATGSILSAAEILARIQSAESDSRLMVAPMLQQPKDHGLDLRLGTRFITFRRTGTASFDPIGEDDDPRALQTYVELAAGEKFVLHPQEIVLGATLEYLVVPDDVSGQVITRSSYGRLGLLSATAVQVHGGFKGCLTLELANLSTIPITLTPGERIAQLVLWQSTSEPGEDRKYVYPIGPEFSRVRQDPEADTLRKLRR